MKKYLLTLAVLVMFATPAHALTVTCTNCSTNLIQLLDRITNVEQLTNAIKVTTVGAAPGGPGSHPCCP